ncbi:MAG: hypothetical protein ACFCVK_04525 [Acidimicrobiales bacterium]
MSFGGFVSAAVADARRDAYDEHLILCAAAGNCVGFVVQPAAFAEVTACAVVDLDHLTVRDDGEFWAGAEPWLPTTLLVVDGTTAQIEIVPIRFPIDGGHISGAHRASSIGLCIG